MSTMDKDLRDRIIKYIDKGMTNKEIAIKERVAAMTVANVRRYHADPGLAARIKASVVRNATAVSKGEPAKPDAQDKPEPMKMYCIKSHEPGKWLTQGKVYEFKDNAIVYDDGWGENSHDIDYNDFVRHNPNLAACLVPLVRRPAKKGEWVYIEEANPIHQPVSYKTGDIFKAKSDHACAAYDIYVDGAGEWIDYNEYLVLDGYKPAEPEKHPDKPTVALHTGAYNYAFDLITKISDTLSITVSDLCVDDKGRAQVSGTLDNDTIITVITNAK